MALTAAAAPAWPFHARSFKGWDIALFSAGGSISKKYAPIASAAGCTVSLIQLFLC